MDPLQAIQWADQGVKAKLSPWRVHVLGLAYYRAGQYDLAIQNLQKSNAIGWNSKPEGAQNWLGLAMAHYRLGRADQARKCLETAQHMIMPVKPARLEDPVGLAPRPIGLSCRCSSGKPKRHRGAKSCGVGIVNEIHAINTARMPSRRAEDRVWPWVGRSCHQTTEQDARDTDA